MDTLVSRARARARGPAIPLATTVELGSPARRTLLLRVLLAVVLLGLAVGAGETGRTSAPAAGGLLPRGGSVMLILDVSRSIKPAANGTIVNVLKELIRSRGHVGLVAFSDIGYELLPPGTPARELRPLLRFFAPAPPRPGPDANPPNPWSTSFSGGTQISAGLILAHNALVQAGEPHGPLLLVSDLDTAPDDVPRVAETFNTFRNEGVPFRIVGLSPRGDNLSLFQHLAGPGAFTSPVQPAGSGVGETEGALHAGTPWALILVAGALLVALAANELWCGRLPVPRTQT